VKNIIELLDLHSDLESMFLTHQRALLRFEFPKALELLNDYERCLLVHMQDEENILIPIYEQQAVVERGGNARLLLDDHKRMCSILELFKEQIELLTTDDEPDTRLLMLLDREAFYKRLCTHHDMREQQYLYPKLDAILSDEEKAALLGRITTDFEIEAT